MLVVKLLPEIAEIAMHRGAIRIDFQRLPTGLQGFVQTALLLPQSSSHRCEASTRLRPRITSRRSAVLITPSPLTSASAS